MKHINENFKINKQLKIENEITEFTNCHFSGTYGLSLTNSKATFKNCTFTGFPNEVINAENSTCSFSRCNFNYNGDNEGFISQLFLEQSKLIMVDCNINQNNQPAIELVNSKAEISNCSIKHNKGYAVSISNGILEIENSTIAFNECPEAEVNQIIAEFSKCRLSNCKVKHCKSGVGIFIRANSELRLENSVTEENLGGIYIENNSRAYILRSEIRKNMDESGDYNQILLDSSQAEIIESTITDGHCGIMCQKGSYCHINGSIVKNNTHGICSFEFSTTIIENSRIESNSKEPQIYSEESKLFVKNSIINPENSVKTLNMIYVKLE